MSLPNRYRLAWSHVLAPDRQAFSNATTWSICTADEVRAPRTKWIVLPVYGSASVPDSTTQQPGVPVAHVREIARQHVVAHVAAIAVDVGGAETEGIAVVAGGALVVVYGERVQSVGG